MRSPGPWRCDDDGTIFDADDRMVAALQQHAFFGAPEGEDRPRTLAEQMNCGFIGFDARLIAAAPELLEWVLAYRDQMDDSEGELAALIARIKGVAP